MGSLQEDKQALRAILRTRRARAAKAGEGAELALAERFLGAVPVAPDAIVAGYFPMGDEIDVRPLLRRLGDDGRVLALPAVTEIGGSLVFRQWREGDPLTGGRLGTREPPAGAPELRPDVVIVPLLAFDRRGYRLGYGGGYYDRTLAALRRRGKVLAVGAGFAAQEVPAVPRGRHDAPLEWVVTEREAIETRSFG